MELSLQDDTIPKENLFMENNKAQSFLIQEYKTGGRTSTEIGVFGRKQAAFMAPPTMIFPLASKGLEAVKKAISENKPFPTLKESRPLSFC